MADQPGTSLSGQPEGLDGAASTDRCVNARRCHGDHDGHGAYTTPPLCPGCLDVAARDLRALVLDYADLEQLLVASGLSELFVAGTREAPTPYAIGIDTLQHDIWHTLTTWEEIIREVAALAEPAINVRQGWAVQHAVAILEPRLATLSRLGPHTVHIDGVPTDQTGLEAVQAIIWLHRRARSALGLTRHVEQLYGRCPVCEWECLRRDSGSETVYCDHCHNARTWDDYRRWLALSYEHALTLKRRHHG